MKCNSSRSCRRAYAMVKGSDRYPRLRGRVDFTQTEKGVIVRAEVFGLPLGESCKEPIFGFHIHSGMSCTGNAENPFADADGHFNPKDCEHPYHAGDLPPLFGNNGYAFMSVLTDRFSVGDIIGRGVIIHRNPDDFKTQPSGNAGEMIACGEIIGCN